MDAEQIITHIVDNLRTVPGVVAIVLGGSRAVGTHKPTSDIDIGIYYADAARFDLKALSQCAANLDDAHRIDVITEIGGWGPWVIGGGWLTVEGRPVDLIYRDAQRVRTAIDDALIGKVETYYQWGHPHGFVTTVYVAEIAHCQRLYDPVNTVDNFKKLLKPYPPRLKEALIHNFGNEAQFMAEVARHGLPRRDISYTAGCCFRSIACLMQVLFAVNEHWMMNEKGAVATAATFPYTVPQLDRQVAEIYMSLTPSQERLAMAVSKLDDLVQGVRAVTEAQRTRALWHA
jgi:predicted nucleotidyltransferase